MSDIRLIDMRPDPIEHADLPMHPDDRRMWAIIKLTITFTLGFVIGATIHRWAV